MKASPQSLRFSVSLAILSAAIALGFPAQADSPAQATFYAAPNGSGQTGTKDEPCSLTGARDLVRKINGNMTGDIIVYLRGGTYALSAPFQLQESPDVHDSGSNGFNVIYEAYPGETPVISGGIVVTGWTLFDKEKGIYRAKVPEGTQSRQLYVNDRRAQRARGPDHPDGWTKTATGWTITDTTMEHWGNPDDIEIVSRSSWKHLRCDIASITGTTVTMKTPGWLYCAKSPKPGNPYNGGGTQQMNKVDWVENALELLQTPGQWYLDHKNAYLYYIPLPEEDINTANIVLPVLEKLIDVSGSDVDHRIHNLQFKGITFKDATWKGPSGPNAYADNQTGVLWVDPLPNTIKAPAGVSFQFASNVVFERNVITQMGGSGLDFGHAPQHDTILGNCIYDISCNGIFAGEFDDAGATDPKAWTDGNSIKDNYITRFGAEYEDGIAICVGYSRNLLLDHNEVFDGPYTGISVGWGWSKQGYSFKNTISNNHVHLFMKILNDGGGIYTLGNQGDADNPTVWSGNYIHDGGHGQGMYSDEGSGFMDIHDNLVCHVGAHWMNIWTKTIHNIHVHDNFADKTNINNNGTDCLVENNTMTEKPDALSDGAKAIANNAGLQADYADIKNAIPKPSVEFINDNDPAITYTGNWKAIGGHNFGDYEKDVHTTGQNGDTAALTFTASSIDFLTETNTDEGDVVVYIDGILVQTVSCQSPDRVAQKAVFHQDWPVESKHEIKIEKKSGGYLLLDAFKLNHKPVPRTNP